MQISTSGDPLEKIELLFQPALKNISKNGATKKAMQSCSICKLDIEKGEFFKHLATAHRDSKQKNPTTPEAINSTVPESPKNESNTLATVTSPKLINCQQDKQFTCKVCAKGFRNSSDLVRHEITHTGDKPFECKVCQQRFNRSSNLFRHSRIHTIGQTSFTCPYCRKKINSSTITVHIKSVHKKNPPEISLLIKPKSTKDGQKSKKLASEINQDRKGLSDDILSKSKVRLVKRKRTRQVKTRKRISCDKCGQFFHHLRNLERHMSSVCEKTELTSIKEKSQPKTLTLEQKIRAFNIKPCKINMTKDNILIDCDAKLMGTVTSVKEKSTIQEKVTKEKSKTKRTTVPKNNKNLTSIPKHEVKQKSLGPVQTKCYGKLNKCSFPGCQKSFKLKSNLQIHYRIHTGEKPFQCKVCLERFTQSGTLQSHERTHTGDKPFECKTCFKRFTQRSPLIRHVRMIHKRGSSTPSPRKKQKKQIKSLSNRKNQPSSQLHKKIPSSEAKSTKVKARRGRRTQTKKPTEATHSFKNPEGTVFACLECSKRAKNFLDLELHMKKAHRLELAANFDKTLLLRKIPN